MIGTLLGSAARFVQKQRLGVLIILVAVGAVVGAGRDSKPPNSSARPNEHGPPADPAVRSTTAGANAAAVRLTEVVTLVQPIAMAVRAGDASLYFAEKSGRVRSIIIDGDASEAEGDNGAPTRLVLDLSGEVALGSEQGLLGLAFSPDGDRLYVNYTDPRGATRVVEFVFAGGRADVGSARPVLSVEQPFNNHNGGNLVFGPDGMLWIGLGDGGSANDPGNRAQKPNTLLGKMLRIDPRPSADKPYSIPPDNPFVSVPGTRPEIWALGLRNPWRYSFDRETGDLWIGDVGQNAVEEIDLEPAGTPGGRNYGWSRFEGTRQITDRAAPAAVSPLFEYDHSAGDCSITGGYVYRGSRIPTLSGVYLYSDFCGGGVRALRRGGDGRAENLGDPVPDARSIVSFGQDLDGELYILTLEGPVYRLDPS